VRAPPGGQWSGPVSSAPYWSRQQRSCISISARINSRFRDMSATIQVTDVLPATESAVRAHAAERTWPLYAVLFSSVSIVIGLIWDISWHRTVGRDTFWSPPHVLEQLAAIVAGSSCGWVGLAKAVKGTPRGPGGGG